MGGRRTGATGHVSKDFSTPGMPKGKPMRYIHCKNLVHRRNKCPKLTGNKRIQPETAVCRRRDHRSQTRYHRRAINLWFVSGSFREWVTFLVIGVWPSPPVPTWLAYSWIF
jgi:hypothetical protein